MVCTEHYYGDLNKKEDTGSSLVGKSDWKTPIGRPKRRGNDIIKTDLKELGCGLDASGSGQGTMAG
jgi:hypothetical protein